MQPGILTPWVTIRGGAELTNPPGHLRRDKWTALSGPLSTYTFPSKVHELATLATREYDKIIAARHDRHRHVQGNLAHKKMLPP